MFFLSSDFYVGNIFGIHMGIHLGVNHLKKKASM